MWVARHGDGHELHAAAVGKTPKQLQGRALADLSLHFSSFPSNMRSLFTCCGFFFVFARSSKLQPTNFLNSIDLSANYSSDNVSLTYNVSTDQQSPVVLQDAQEPPAVVKSAQTGGLEPHHYPYLITLAVAVWVGFMLCGVVAWTRLGKTQTEENTDTGTIDLSRIVSIDSTVTTLDDDDDSSHII